MSNHGFPFPPSEERTDEEQDELVRLAASGDYWAKLQWDYENALVPDE